MNRLTTRIGLLALAAAGALITACATPPTPSSPPPTQPPPPSQTQPPPTETREQQAQTSEAAGATAEAEPSSAQSQQTADQGAAAAREATTESDGTPASPPPSSTSPDVEITDIPLDEDGNPIIQPAAQQRSNAGTTPPAATGGGGAPTPAGGRESANGTNTGGGTPAPGEFAGEAIDVGSATTAAEHSANLEQDLEAKLAEFDELMRKARQEAEREQAGGGAMAGAAWASGARREASTETGAGGRAARSSGLGNTPDTSGTTQAGTYRPAPGAVPSDVPDARDDDIVARQLREAATRESDPALREKLWQEYRKYKTGIGG